MKTYELELDDDVFFEIQKGISFNQQSKFQELIEEYIDLVKLKELQGKMEEPRELTMREIAKVLKDGAKLTSFNTELTKFCLFNFVVKPEITEAVLDDPDDSNALNYAVLGTELVKTALTLIAEQSLLKKTPKI